MSKRRRASAPAQDLWDEEGRRLAPQLAGVSAAIVVGLNASAAARVALAAARATAHERRVALADLAGALSALDVIAADAVAPGITESFLHGTTLNDVARPAADGRRCCLSSRPSTRRRWPRLCIRPTAW
ncbi:MAG: hypothetical protein HYV19_02215 [Gemmatimonadetes bacterium]|nr:hypothetical protein [Gemmatimonadota bacterium]